jgi:hypothetical protein
MVDRKEASWARAEFHREFPASDEPPADHMRSSWLGHSGCSRTGANSDLPANQALVGENVYDTAMANTC